MHSRQRPSFLGVTLPSVALPQLPAAFEAAAVVAAVVGFGLGWAWFTNPAQPTTALYPAGAMSGANADAAEASAAIPSERVEQWLVDGFNLLHAVLLGGEERSRWWTASGRSRVLDAVAHATHEREHARVWVVFDGSRLAPDAGGPLHSVFARSADDWLVARVKAAERPERTVVVTADRSLAGRARHHGAVVQSPSEFLARAV